MDLFVQIDHVVRFVLHLRLAKAHQERETSHLQNGHDARELADKLNMTILSTIRSRDESRYRGIIMCYKVVPLDTHSCKIVGLLIVKAGCIEGVPLLTIR